MAGIHLLGVVDIFAVPVVVAILLVQRQLVVCAIPAIPAIPAIAVLDSDLLEAIPIPEMRPTTAASSQGD